MLHGGSHGARPRVIVGVSHQQPHECDCEGASKRCSHRRHVRREHEVPRVWIDQGPDRAQSSSYARPLLITRKSSLSSFKSSLREAVVGI